MRCQEANEWISRYLDHDLSELEQKQLFQHLDSCSNCAETFARMSRISAQLDNLPDVQPKFSLVDSILPRLEEIDRSNTQDEIKGELVSAPVEMAPLTSVERPASMEREEVKRASRRRRPVWTRFAAGAAAAVILGFCVYQFQPKSIPNAEPAIDNSVATNKQMPTSEPFGAAASTEPSAQVSASPSSGTSSGNASANPQSTSPAGIVTSSPDATSSQADASAELKSGTQSNASSSAPAASPEVPVNSQQAEPSAQPTPAASTEDDKVTRQAVIAPSGSPSTSESAAPKPGVPAPSTQSLVPSASSDAKKETSAAGIQSMVALEEWTSPDGTYVAKLENGHLNVYLDSSGNLIKIYDDPVTGEWEEGSGSWSGDSKIFSYTVIEEGSPVQSQVDAKQAAADIQK
jgi:hypothetical protein